MGPSDKVLTQLQKMLSNTMLACKIIQFLVLVSSLLFKRYFISNILKRKFRLNENAACDKDGKTIVRKKSAGFQKKYLCSSFSKKN